MKSCLCFCSVVLLICQSGIAQESALKGAISASQQESAPQQEAEQTGPHAVGDTASDFELQSIGEKIKLSDRFGEEGKPVVVVFSRANW